LTNKIINKEGGIINFKDWYKNKYFETDLGYIIHGDCLEVMDELIHNGAKFDAIITDIPYGTTECKWDTIIPFDEMWNKLKKIRKDNTPIILFGKQPFTSYLNISNIDEFKYEIIWEKDKGTDFGNANRKPLNIHENISVFYKKQPKYNKIKDEGEPYIRKNKRNNGKEDLNFKSDNSGTWINKGGRTPTTVRKINRYSAGGKKPLHPTQKPIELLEWLIKSYSNKNDIILDFTAGSMTTGLAAEQLNRRWICIEKEEKYCELGKQRFIEST
jgi:site-specific DNA-methyltransferase (adenine-specific)